MQTCKVCGEEKDVSSFRLTVSGNPRGRCRDCEKAYQRQHYWKNPEHGRAKASRSMKKLRRDPERRDAHLEKQRAYYHAKAKHREREYYRNMRERFPWEWRARNLRRNINVGITAQWLHERFDEQRGTCPLTGRPIDVATFHVDHIIPTSRGGSDDLTNLRLVCPEANCAKQGLTDEEFVALCADVIAKAQIPELIARRLIEVPA